MCRYGPSVLKKANKETSPRNTVFLWLETQVVNWALQKNPNKNPHNCPQKGALCLAVNNISRFFFPFIIFYVLYFGAPFNTRLRGNTESSVVDTGVSLSTHTSPISSTPLGRLISYRARKWEEGQCSRRAWSDDVTAGNKDSDCCRWNEQAGEWVRGQG